MGQKIRYTMTMVGIYDPEDKLFKEKLTPKQWAERDVAHFKEEPEEFFRAMDEVLVDVSAEVVD